MARKPIVRIIGSLNIDFVTLTPRVPGPGETLEAKSMTVHAGGKGSNQAVACGKAAYTSATEQDVQVEMLGAVGAGDPYYASLLKPTLAKSGVGTRYVEEVEGVQTGTATIIVDEGSNGENRILFVPGANHHVTDVAKVVATATQDGVPDVVVMQGEIPKSTVLGLLSTFNGPEEEDDGHRQKEKKKKKKTCVVFNPAPMFDGIPLAALRNLAVLVVNETECLLLFKAVQELRDIETPSSGDDGSLAPHLDRLTAHLHELAAISIVIVTLGSRGLYYSAAQTRTQSRSRGLIPAAKVAKVVDTTGAGDTFVGYFSTAVARHVSGSDHGTLEGFDVHGAALRANDAAAKCVQRSGAMESIPFGYEV
ncbi:ribokinase [Exophiala spinifera]|uniref:Ribokinase n=1 Tax=Exophiala spinifera TaxID=91928 RepID=A0A0D2BRV3_9EURO|nr:ribokinase [Exophiala spinifera]KIW21140.1 ribokinase [Exophiala spinifera]